MGGIGSKELKQRSLRRHCPAFFVLGTINMPPRKEIAPELMASAKYLYEETLTPIDEIAMRIGLSRTSLYRRIIEGRWIRRRYTSCEALILDERARGEVPPMIFAQNEPASVSAQSPPSNPIDSYKDEPVKESRSPDERNAKSGMVAPAFRFAPCGLPTSDAISSDVISSEEMTPADERALLYSGVLKAGRRQLDAIERMQKMLELNETAQPERTTRLSASVNKMLCELAVIAKPDKVTPPDETDDDPLPRDIDEFRRELARRIAGLVDAERRRAEESSCGA